MNLEVSKQDIQFSKNEKSNENVHFFDFMQFDNLFLYCFKK
jgi:hypothetical protein